MRELDLREEIFKEFLTSNPEGIWESVFEDTVAFINRNENLTEDFLKTPISQWRKKFKDFLLEKFNPSEFEKTFDCFDKEFKKIIERRQMEIIKKIKRKFHKVKKGEELTLVSMIIDHSDTLKELQRYYDFSSSIIFHLIESQIGEVKKIFDGNLEEAEEIFGTPFTACMGVSQDGGRPVLKFIVNTTEGKCSTDK